MNFKLLKRNVKQFKNVKIENKGAHKLNLVEKIYLDSDSGGRNSLAKEWTQSDKFEVINLVDINEYLNKEKIKKIDILKLDTEGCEVPILDSMRNFLKDIKVIYLEYHSKEDRNIIVNILSSSHLVVREKIVGGELRKINLNFVKAQYSVTFYWLMR